MAKILLLGCGNMGGALLKRWSGDDQHTIIVADPANLKLTNSIRQVKSGDELEADCVDYLIVALKPQIIDQVLPGYIPALKPDGVLVSIAAGYSMQRLGKHIHEQGIIRVMPNLPAMIGQGVSGLCASEKTRDADKAVIESLMALSGETLWVDSEDGLDRLTAVAGSGPGYIFEIARAYIQAAEELGFTPDQAKKLVMGTMKGTLALAGESDLSLSELRNSVTSKGGTTAAGLNALNGNQEFSNLISRTLKAAYARAEELR